MALRPSTVNPWRHAGADLARRAAATATRRAFIVLGLAPPLLAPSRPLPPTEPVLVWRVETGAPVRSTPAFAAGTLFVGNERGDVLAVAAVTGDVLWHATAGGGVASELAVAGDLLLVSDRAGQLSAFARQDGQLRWRVTIGDSVFADRIGRAGRSRYDPWDYFTASPLIDGDRIFVGAPDGTVAAVRLADGGVIWARSTAGPVRGRPALAGDVVVVGSFDGTVRGFDRDRGAERWRFKTRGNPDFPKGEVQGSPAVVDGDVVVGSRDYRLYRLDGATGALEWEYEDPSWIIARPVVDRSYLYVGSSDSHMGYGIDPATGRVRWATDLGANVFGSAALWGDLVVFPTTEVYTADDKGFLVGLERDTGTVRWRLPVGGNVRSTPVAAGNLLIAGSESGTLSAWQLAQP